MGDFEDAFGSGGSSDSIIDRYSRDYDYVSPPPKPYRRWFPDLDAALLWERENPGIGFTRNRKLGGFEIETFDTSGRPGIVTPIDPLSEKVSCLELPIDIHEAVSLPANCLVPTNDGKTGIVHLFDYMVESLPDGRCDTFPLRFTRQEFLDFMSSMPIQFTFDLEVGNGAVIITSDDHGALIGRLHGDDDIRIEPWFFDLIHLKAGDPGENWSCCFHCNHLDPEEAGGHSLYGRTEIFSEPGGMDDFRPIDANQYVSPTRDEVGVSILYWLTRLSPSTQLLSPDRLPPALVVPFMKLSQADLRQARGVCKVLACAVCIMRGDELSSSVEIVFYPSRCISGHVPIWEVRASRRTAGELFLARRSKLRSEDPSNGTKVHEPLPSLAHFNPGFMSDLQPEGFGFVASRKGPYEAQEKIEASFHLGEMSNHQKIAAAGFLRDLKLMDLPPAIRQLLD